MRQTHQITVFAASPSDVAAERAELKAVVEELNQPNDIAADLKLTLQLVDWRQAFPKMGRPEGVILDQLNVDSWDIFVGILWHRFGSPTGGSDPATQQSYDSGTYEEFCLAYQALQQTGRPHILMYRCTRDVSSGSRDEEQFRKLQTFWGEFGPEGAHPGLIKEFGTPQEFARMAGADLRRLLLQNFRTALHTADLRDSRSETRKEAASALGKAGPDASSAIPALTRALSDTSPPVRAASARALCRIGVPACSAGPALVRALDDEAWEVRATAAQALGAVGYEPETTIPRLIALLSDEHERVSYSPMSRPLLA